MLRASLCTATYETASPVEVWSLWPCKSTCTEITGFSMNTPIQRESKMDRFNCGEKIEP